MSKRGGSKLFMKVWELVLSVGSGSGVGVGGNMKKLVGKLIGG